MRSIFSKAETRWIRCRLALGLCGFVAATHALAADILVFTDRSHPIEAPASVRVIALDAAAHIQSDLSANLPADPARATAIVQQRLAEGGADLQRRLANAYQGVADAWSLGVTKIPAVVVDQRYVVYGETDVSRALARIEQYRREQP